MSATVTPIGQSEARIVRRALLSVSDKTGLVEFARALAGMRVELISTGGTAKLLREAGLSVRDVSEVTGFPEMMDGRLKTLHPRIHGGLLAVRGDGAHMSAAEAHGIPNIDLLAVNLYPFEETVEKGAEFADAIENIDIGGPAMIRAAAKNHQDVTVLVDPADYTLVLDEMRAHHGATLPGLRRHLAAKAFARTGAYDAAIAGWFYRRTGQADPAGSEPAAPKYLPMAGVLKQTLRYGENPHQWGAFYVTDKRPGVATAEQLQGKELSYNNINDTNAAYELVSEFDPAAAPAAVIVKHANPCGVAVGATLKDAYLRALACDPVSAFGGVIALNRPLDGPTAGEIARIFTEVIVAPEADAAARTILGAKKNLRLLIAGGLPDPAAPGMNLVTVSGGFLVQSRDNGRVARDMLKVVTKRAPTPQELEDLIFAFRVAKHVKSNAIVYAKNGATVGIGAGQMSRVDSSRIAASKAAEAAREAGETGSRTEGSVVASDAFFPFPDGLLAAASAGATAVIQPGGSVRDEEVVAAADEKNLAMVFTGQRHFRH